MWDRHKERKRGEGRRAGIEKGRVAVEKWEGGGWEVGCTATAHATELP
jgi:hypothetical protein